MAAQSLSSKSKFDGDALHDDRVRTHQGINRSIQLCMTDSQGRLMAIPSEDGIEICLPGIAPESGHFNMGLLPSMLFEQTALSSEVSDFQYTVVWLNSVMISMTSNLGIILSSLSLIPRLLLRLMRRTMLFRG